jgi:hypothetical protein
MDIILSFRICDNVERKILINGGYYISRAVGLVV